MNKIRVLLVDDAAVVRRLVAAALGKDPELEVVGTAADGQIALNRLGELRPDVVVLDLEMPVLDGLQTLVQLRKTHPRLPVVMFSRFTQRGVEATVHALTLGADDYVPKPGDGLNVESCLEEHLIPKIKLLARKRAAATIEPPPGRTANVTSSVSVPRRIDLIVIGASTGGPNALTSLLMGLPNTLGTPMLIVQHMPAEFTARLAERLAEKSKFVVREGAPGERLSAAQVWVAPGNYHLRLSQERGLVRLALDQDAPVNSCRPAVDVSLASAADVFGPNVLAVILTGMGQDGLRGCERIRAAGGQVLAQDEASSVVWSMPGAVAKAGLANAVLPLDEIGPEIIRRTLRGSQAPRSSLG